ncbi:unnamed protein product [Fusarium graminearum]|nr:unnamed protein product [Fusarium graminearum]
MSISKTQIQSLTGVASPISSDTWFTNALLSKLSAFPTSDNNPLTVLGNRLNDLKQTLQINLVQYLNQWYSARDKRVCLVDEFAGEKIFCIINQPNNSLDRLGRQQRFDRIDQSRQINVIQRIQQWHYLANQLGEINLRECVQKRLYLFDEVAKVNLAKCFKQSTSDERLGLVDELLGQQPFSIIQQSNDTLDRILCEEWCHGAQQTLEIKLAKHLQERANLIKEVLKVQLGKASEEWRSFGDKTLCLRYKVLGKQVLRIVEQSDNALDGVLGEQGLHSTQKLVQLQLADLLQERPDLVEQVCQISLVQTVQKWRSLGNQELPSSRLSSRGDAFEIKDLVWDTKSLILSVAQQADNALHRLLCQKRSERVKNTCEINLSKAVDEGTSARKKCLDVLDGFLGKKVFCIVEQADETLDSKSLDALDCFLGKKVFGIAEESDKTLDRFLLEDGAKGIKYTLQIDIRKLINESLLGQQILGVVQETNKTLNSLLLQDGAQSVQYTLEFLDQWRSFIEEGLDALHGLLGQQVFCIVEQSNESLDSLLLQNGAQRIKDTLEINITELVDQGRCSANEILSLVHKLGRQEALGVLEIVLEKRLYRLEDLFKVELGKLFQEWRDVLDDGTDFAKKILNLVDSLGCQEIAGVLEKSDNALDSLFLEKRVQSLKNACDVEIGKLLEERRKLIKERRNVANECLGLLDKLRSQECGAVGEKTLDVLEVVIGEKLEHL